MASELEYRRAMAIAGPEADSIAKSWTSRDPLEEVAAAVEVQRILSNALPVEDIFHLLAVLRLRYSIAIGQAQGRNGISLPSVPNEQEARAEIRAILDRLKTVYLLRVHRERFVTLVNLHSIIMLFAFLGFVGLAAIIQSIDHSLSSLANYMTVASIGAIGALISILRRAQIVGDRQQLQEDPVVQANLFKSGYWGIWISMMLGPVFALTLAALFMSGELSFAGVTPAFAPASPQEAQFRALDHYFKFASNADAAKMVFWAFLAGFAETFVPDVLDRFSKAP